VGFEHKILAGEQPQTCTLDRAATGTSKVTPCSLNIALKGKGKSDDDDDSRDHVLSAEELKTGWLFPFQPRHHSRIWIASDFSLVVQTMIGLPVSMEGNSWPRIVRITQRLLYKIFSLVGYCAVLLLTQVSGNKLASSSMVKSWKLHFYLNFISCTDFDSQS